MMKTNKTIQKIIKTITSENLISHDDRVLVALSGGADSVFLLLALLDASKTIGFEVAACHVEHGIRGKASLDDMNFCESLCNGLDIKFYAKSFDVVSISKKQKISVEAAGRKVRYDYFDEIIKDYGYTLVATAHHKDDKIETILMNILRGCGLRGFMGIDFKNGNIIRPLLNISKREILDYCRENSVSYCTDETNYDTEYTRNKIRHVLLPNLREFNPSLDESLIRQSIIFSGEDDYMHAEARLGLKNCLTQNGIDINKLSLYHTALKRRIIYMYIAKCRGTELDITFGDVESAIELCEKGETGKTIYLSKGIKVGIEYGVFSVMDESQIKSFEYRLELDRPVDIVEAGIRVTLYNSGGNLSLKDTDDVIIRSSKDGDVFYPVGMTGRKKIKDFFQSKKISRYNRHTVPLLVINGEIASVVGMRNDRRFFGGKGRARIETEQI